MRAETDSGGALVYACPSPAALLLQPVGAQKQAGLEAQLAAIRAGSDVPFLFAGVPVRDWNGALSPWQAPPVFGSEGFGSGAAETLAGITELLPRLRRQYDLPAELPVILGGYSLAGLFCLWSACQCDCFSGVMAASPSVWFPGWMDYAAAHKLRVQTVYLSLGDREARAKNPVLASLGDCIRRQAALLAAQPETESTLEWNEGNHFRDPELRCARGFAWCLNRITGDRKKWKTQA